MTAQWPVITITLNKLKYSRDLKGLLKVKRLNCNCLIFLEFILVESRARDLLAKEIQFDDIVVTRK